MNTMILIKNYLSDPNNWCKPEDRTFYTWFLVLAMTSTYIMIGLYYHFPDVLDMIYWPINRF